MEYNKQNDMITSLIEGTTFQHDILVNEAYNYLNNTDWVISKINEYSLLGEDIKPLLDKYAPILEKRKNARKIINGEV